MFQKGRSKKLSVARNLPPSFHRLPELPYSPLTSEVIQWLIKRPSILEYLWDHIKDSGDVVYDSKSGRWRGVDYED